MQAIDSGCSVLNHAQVGILGVTSRRVTDTHSVNPPRPVYLTNLPSPPEARGGSGAAQLSDALCAPVWGSGCLRNRLRKPVLRSSTAIARDTTHGMKAGLRAPALC